jgi:hypothetical protein
MSSGCECISSLITRKPLFCKPKWLSQSVLNFLAANSIYLITQIWCVQQILLTWSHKYGVFSKFYLPDYTNMVCSANSIYLITQIWCVQQILLTWLHKYGVFSKFYLPDYTNMVCSIKPVSPGPLLYSGNPPNSPAAPPTPVPWAFAAHPVVSGNQRHLLYRRKWRAPHSSGARSPPLQSRHLSGAKRACVTQLLSSDVGSNHREQRQRCGRQRRESRCQVELGATYLGWRARCL